jgi:hypothetical protein
LNAATILYLEFCRKTFLDFVAPQHVVVMGQEGYKVRSFFLTFGVEGL